LFNTLKYLLFAAVFVWNFNWLFGQENVFRTKEIRPGKDTLVLDTLSIVSEDFQLLGEYKNARL